MEGTCSHNFRLHLLVHDVVSIIDARSEFGLNNGLSIIKTELVQSINNGHNNMHLQARPAIVTACPTHH